MFLHYVLLFTINTDRIESYEGTLGDAALTHGPHLLLK